MQTLQRLLQLAAQQERGQQLQASAGQMTALQTCCRKQLLIQLRPRPLRGVQQLQAYGQMQRCLCQLCLERLTS